MEKKETKKGQKSIFARRFSKLNKGHEKNLALFNGPFDQMKSEKKRKGLFYSIKKEQEKLREKIIENKEENLKREENMLFLERKFNNRLIGVKN